MNRLQTALSLACALAVVPLVHAQETAWPSPPYKRATVDSATCPRPEYPAASLQANEEGKVLLLFLVDAKGKILREQVARSSGHARLDQAAQDALRRCRFNPFSSGDGPTESVAQVEYVWRIKPSTRFLAVPASTASGCQPPAMAADAGADAPKAPTRLSLLLSAEGWVDLARVETSSGNARLDALALGAYAQCRFRAPPEADGALVKGMVTVDHAWK